MSTLTRRLLTTGAILIALAGAGIGIHVLVRALAAMHS